MMRIRRHRGPGRPFVGVLCFLAITLAPGLATAAENGAAAEPPDAPNASPVRAMPQRTPAQLFAGVESAWAAGAAATIASYCDSATAHVSLKPGGSPASAPTLGGLSFLIDDQLRFVVTKQFRIVRFEVDGKKRTARAWARWNGDWGGAKGARDLEVQLTARARSDGLWLLTEVRAND